MTPKRAAAKRQARLLLELRTRAAERGGQPVSAPPPAPPLRQNS